MSELDSFHSEEAREPANTGLTRRSRLLRLGFWPVAFAVILGVLGGVGVFTFGYGQGASYLSNDPTACANCHVMQPYFDSWQNSGHRHVAVCNDCHLPHNFAGKWITKADNGFFHSLAFTLENFHEPIQIKSRNRRVTQSACLHCHAETVHHMMPVEPAETGQYEGAAEFEMLLCIHCHSSAGHAGR